MGTVSFKLEGEEADAVRAFLKVVDAQKKTEDATGRTNESFRKQRRATKEAADGAQGLRNELLGALTAYGLVEKGIAAVTAALRLQMETAKSAANRVREGATAAGGGLMLGPEKAAKVAAQVRAARTGAGMAPEPAQRLVEALHRHDAGTDENVRLFDQFKGIAADPAELAESTLKMREAYGADKVGTERQALNRMLKAGEISGVGAEKLGPLVTDTAVSGSAIGSSAAEQLAAVATLAKSTKSPEKSAGDVKALNEAFAKHGIQNGLVDAVERGASHNLTDEQLGKQGITGPALEGYKLVLAHLEEIKAARAEITAAGKADVGSDEVDKILTARESNPRLFAPYKVDISTQKKLVAEEENLALAQLHRDDVHEWDREQAAELREGGINRGLGEYGHGLDNLLGSDEEVQGLSPEEAFQRRGRITTAQRHVQDDRDERAAAQKAYDAQPSERSAQRLIDALDKLSADVKALQGVVDRQGKALEENTSATDRNTKDTSRPTPLRSPYPRNGHGE